MTVTDLTHIQELTESTKDHYQKLFSNGNENDIVYYSIISPGRVNLIGEHVDYNGGYVLPMAINYYTVCYGTGRLVKGNVGKARICAMNIDPSNILEVNMSLNMTPLEDKNKWANYVLGVVQQYWNHYLKEDEAIEVQIAIQGNIPLGSGLSSSASIEIAIAKLLEQILQLSDVSHKTRALHCQKAENVFCSSPCGIMDQYICSAAEHNHALFIDCTTYDYTQVPFITDNVSIVICNSNVTHSIADGEYPIRVAQCQKALSIIKDNIPELKDIKSLRFATLQQLESIQDKFNNESIVYNRAYHVITEDQRTLKAKDALQKNDFDTMGKLMYESHASLRDYFEVSCGELDVLVQLAKNYQNEGNKVYGSRMTGGGFGGCTVTLIKKELVDDFKAYLIKEYYEKTGMDCSCFVSDAVTGVHCVA